MFEIFRINQLRTNEHGLPLRVVWDAAVQMREFADGSPIPLLILDTSLRSDVARFINVHTEVEAGEVEFRWGQLTDKPTHWALIVDATLPISCKFIIEFEIAHQGILVETMMNSHACYLQAGSLQDTFMGTVQTCKTLVNLPDVEAKPHWDKIFYETLFQKYRKVGLNRKDANLMARARIAFARGLTRRRLI